MKKINQYILGLGLVSLSLSTFTSCNSGITEYGVGS